jgi:cytochrome c biogenesis protein
LRHEVDNLLIGSTVGSFGGYMAQEVVPRGEFFHSQNLVKLGRISNITQDISWRVNDFWITYTEDFKTNQFYSDLSLIDNRGNELKGKTIFVNEPFVYKEVTIYQTDWEVLGLKLQVDNGKLFQVPLKKSNINGRRLWVSSINVYENGISQIVLVVNDLTGKIFIYNEKGTSLGEVEVGSKIQLNSSTSLKILNFVDGTGLESKEDSNTKLPSIV